MFLRQLFFCDYIYDMNKETKKSVGVLVDTLVLTLLMCLLKTQIAIILSNTKDNDVELFVCSQKVKFVNMLLEDVSEV